jgi:hypothetical protein
VLCGEKSEIRNSSFVRRLSSVIQYLASRVFLAFVRFAGDNIRLTYGNKIWSIKFIGDINVIKRIPLCPATAGKLLFLVLCVLSVLCGKIAAAEVNQPSDFNHTHSPTGFIKSISWGYPGNKGQYQGDASADSMKKLAETNANWVCISFVAEMNKPGDTTIIWTGPDANIVSDSEIQRAIGLARQNNLKIILKPMVNIRDGTWRALIDFRTPDNKIDTQSWDKWWANYGEFILHYAKIAQETHCEMLCLGCEMGSTERYGKKWRDLIAEVRKVYTGFLTYSANHGNEDRIGWWDAIDIIGMSGYYPVGIDNPAQTPNDLSTVPPAESSVEAMKNKWLPIKKKLGYVSKQVNRPLFFIEIGVCSARGFAAAPWTHPQKDATFDGNEQARFYQAVMEAFWDEPWFVGFSWWDWPANLYSLNDAKTDTGFCIYGKPAEKLIKEWYAKPR